MKISLSEALRVRNGLEYLLNGRDRIVRRNNEDTVIREPFKLEADTLLAIAINSGKLHGLQEAYTRAYNALIKELSGGTGSVPPASSEAINLAEKNQALLDAEHDVELTQIEVAKLKIDDNPGIAAVLTQILPVVKTA